MKSRAELAEAVCEAARKLIYDKKPYRFLTDDWAFISAMEEWRNAPPDPPELKITPGPMILSPPDKLSEEEVWMRAVESCLRSQTLATHRVVFEADEIVNAFREKFRKESK